MLRIFSGGDALDRVLLISALLICVYIHEAIQSWNFTASIKIKDSFEDLDTKQWKKSQFKTCRNLIKEISPIRIVRMRQIELP